MASVRGTDPRLVAGSDPDCVTTNQDRDPTYPGTGPDQLPWPTMEKKNGQNWIEKIGHTKRTHLSQRKRSPNCFCFCFCSTPFFLWFKGIKLKEKSKIKKNRSPDPAILGQVRTWDPDPGHFGPDFDSRSGHGSAFTDLWTGCLPESTDDGTLRTVFMD
jgi:hypothetical protein